MAAVPLTRFDRLRALRNPEGRPGRGNRRLQPNTGTVRETGKGLKSLAVELRRRFYALSDRHLQRPAKSRQSSGAGKNIRRLIAEAQPPDKQ
jgi:hypothetical protein